VPRIALSGRGTTLGGAGFRIQGSVFTGHGTQDTGFRCLTSRGHEVMRSPCHTGYNLRIRRLIQAGSRACGTVARPGKPDSLTGFYTYRVPGRRRGPT
jgi:hypothetical protein